MKWSTAREMEREEYLNTGKENPACEEFGKNKKKENYKTLCMGLEGREMNFNVIHH